jgi:chemotaxis protein CheX
MDSEPSLINLLDELLKAASEEVFSTMLGIPVQWMTETAAGAVNGEQIIGNIGLAGTVSAVVYLRFPAQFTSILTTQLLGMGKDDPASNEIVNDAVGELTNMVVGHTKTRLCDRGLTCTMTPPSILRGRDLRIGVGLATATSSLYFSCQQYPLEIMTLTKPTLLGSVSRDKPS